LAATTNRRKILQYQRDGVADRPEFFFKFLISGCLHAAAGSLDMAARGCAQLVICRSGRVNLPAARFAVSLPSC
jgi:hypothetical protein